MLREENYNEYLRLLHDDDYYDVTYDEKSGGVSAVHKLHKFAKQRGVYGMRRGDYERAVMEVLRIKGYRIILESEMNTPGIKSCDGYLNDIRMEIKSIEGMGVWAVTKKLHNATKQNAECVVLFFPEESLYSPSRVAEGVRLFRTGLNDSEPEGMSRLLIVVQDRLITEIVFD